MRQTKKWGFPRWGGYNLETDPVSVRMCDREGCTERGDHQAPKSRHTKDKWWFCQAHAAEYNRSWNYFEGMSAEEAAEQAEEDRRQSEGYSKSNTWTWGGAGSGDAVRRDALATLELDDGATEEAIKSQFRKLAKRYHPDTNPDDKTASVRFHQITAAYELLTTQANARQRRTG